MSEQINIFDSIFLKDGQLQLLRDLKTCAGWLHAVVGKFNPGPFEGGLQHLTAVGEPCGTRPSARHCCGRAELPCDRLIAV